MHWIDYVPIDLCLSQIIKTWNFIMYLEIQALCTSICAKIHKLRLIISYIGTYYLKFVLNTKIPHNLPATATYHRCFNKILQMKFHNPRKRNLLVTKQQPM